MIYFYNILSLDNNEILFKDNKSLWIAIKKIRIVLKMYLIYYKYEFVGVHWDTVVP